MKSREEIMEILEAFDLTGSFRDAGELAGCSHHTVAGYVAKRDAGELPVEQGAHIDASLGVKGFFGVAERAGSRPLAGVAGPVVGSMSGSGK